MSCKTSTRVVQVTGFLPLPVSHSWKISVLICSELLRFLWAIILTLDPFWSSKRRVPNWTYLVAISTGRLTTLPSVHVNLSIVLVGWVQCLGCVRGNSRNTVVI